MKKLVLSATLLLSVATFAQKDELKTLKKLYAKETISEKDLVSYKTASDALQNLATEEGDKVYAKFYKAMTPTVELTSKGNKVSPQDLIKVFNPEFIKEYGAIINEVVEFEKKSGKKILTDELIADKESFRTEFSNMALDLNKASKFKEASALFYSLYLFDPKKEGKSLNNAAILAVQAKDYILGQKYYEEFYNSDYFATASTYYAINKANGAEEDLGSRENRTKFISLGLYEKPRDEKISKSKPEILKILSILYSENKEFDKAKAALTEARELLPNDEDLKTTEFNLYFNEGYASLADEAKLVDQINASTADKKKYDDLMNQRKAMFQKALPAFEKAYSINPADENTKSILKIAYDVTGQKEKANAIK